MFARAMDSRRREKPRRAGGIRRRGRESPAKEPVYIYAREETSRNPARPEKSDTPRGDRRRVSLSHPASLIRGDADPRFRGHGTCCPFRTAIWVSRIARPLAHTNQRRDYVCAVSRTHAHTNRTHELTPPSVSSFLPFASFSPFLFLSVSLSCSRPDCTST